MDVQNIPLTAYPKNLPEVRQNIMTTLAYFDMFNYPLTRAEIYFFLGKKYQYDLFNGALNYLVTQEMVYQFDRFFTLKNNTGLVTRRIEGNARAARLIKTAKKIGALLIRFPFVRGVAISGSLSKNFADENSDIDLFIITAKNRLWLARTLTHALKKLSYLVKREHYFCMNYYIDEQELQIAEKNIYTAIEVGTLIPLEGDLFFEKFYAANTWTRDFLPNKNMRVSSAKPIKKMPLKLFFEWLLSGRAGNRLDDALMRVTAVRWDKKALHKQLNSHGQLMAMLAEKHFSKPDPVNFQANLLLRYELKVERLLRDHERTLVP